VAARA
jgi:hypothetical protein